MTAIRTFAGAALCGAMCLVAANPAAGQEKGNLLPSAKFEQSQKRVQSEATTESQTLQPSSDGWPSFSCDGAGNKDKQVHDACIEALTENYAYEAARLRHRRWTFSFQLYVANVSFVLVVIIVGFGLFFAYVQFSREFPRLPVPKAAQEMLPGTVAGSWDKPSETQIELSFAKIKVSSSILGVIVLGLAMGFFYLYIQFIFPIQAVN